MNEISARDIARDVLKLYGYRVRVVTDGIRCTYCNRIVVPQPGRPDMKAVHPFRRTIYVEVKFIPSDGDSLSFRVFDGKDGRQRCGLIERAGQGFLTYVAIGVARNEGKGDRMKRIYLIPWTVWLEAEEKITPYQDTIPLVAKKHYDRDMQEKQLDIVTLFQGWELVKRKRGWGIPDTHPLYAVVTGGGT